MHVRRRLDGPGRRRVRVVRGRELQEHGRRGGVRGVPRGDDLGGRRDLGGGLCVRRRGVSKSGVHHHNFHPSEIVWCLWNRHLLCSIVFDLSWWGIGFVN